MILSPTAKDFLDHVSNDPWYYQSIISSSTTHERRLRSHLPGIPRLTLGFSSNMEMQATLDIPRSVFTSILA